VLLISHNTKDETPKSPNGNKSPKHLQVVGGTLVKKSRKYMKKNIRCNILVVG
jgi:hypothetical protein